VSLNDAKKLERMINQNTFDDILQDLFYWEDPSDEFKVGNTSVLVFVFSRLLLNNIIYKYFNYILDMDCKYFIIIIIIMYM
jgi:hypothetical protein